MQALEDYLYDMEAAPDEPSTGQGLVAPSLTVLATGTCGVTTPACGLAWPLAAVSASGDWRPLGIADLPAMQAMGAQALWRPAWGELLWPLADGTGQARVPLTADLALTPLFGLSRAGARASTLTLPGIAPYGLSGLDRQGTAAGILPRATAVAWSCSLDDPTTNGTSAERVVGLLCQGNETLSLAAASLAQGASLATLGADGLAGRLLDALGAGLVYAADSDSDVWTCALGTYFRGFGDCEDGAILLHALLLAAGLPADRLVTVFGRVGLDRQGHVWLTYRRESDGQWVVLDWTAGPTATNVADLPPIQSLPYYATVDYALTAQAFFVVRQSASAFFTRVDVDDLRLPALGVGAGASLGVAADCALASHWLRATAWGAGRGQGVLPTTTSSARSGFHAATAELPSPGVLAGSGAWASPALAEPTGLGSALGGSARSGRLVPGVELAATAVQARFGTAALQLARMRMLAAGMAGQCGGGMVVLPEALLRAHGWPGSLARLQTCLAGLDGLGRGGASDPGQGLATLPPWLGRGRGQPDGSALADYCWSTTTPEIW